MALHHGRWTHAGEDGLVVFLIGMRVNRPRQVRAWWPVFRAMPAMLRELADHPGSGFLGARMAVGPGGPLLVQYWRDRESLLAFARDPGRSHRPAWRAFNARARAADGAVGIWHETYEVPAEGVESVYVDMPLAGLAAATGSVPAAGRRDRAPGAGQSAS